jgi:hypothetical protein
MEQLPQHLMNKLLLFYSECENNKKVPWTWVFHPSDITLVEESTTIPKLDKMRGDGNTVTESIENLLEVLIVRNNGK